MTVYRIPLKRVYNRKPGRVAGDPTWNDVYGKAKCGICKKHFEEGDAYVVLQHSDGKKRKLICGHVACEEKKHEDNDVKVPNRSRKPKDVQGLRKKIKNTMVKSKRERKSQAVG